MAQPLTARVDGARARRWRAVLGVLAGLVLLAILVVMFFPWDVLREPVNRHASERLGRRFEITQRLEVHPGFPTRIVLHGVVLANPEWAARPNLIEAERADFTVRLLPLLRGRIVLPELSLQNPRIALQMEPDGRRSWSLSRDTSDRGAAPVVGALRVDRGQIYYASSGQRADVAADFSIDRENAQDMPLRFRARGTFKGESFEASGRTGGVLQLEASSAKPFPVSIDAAVGQTSLKAAGTVAKLASLDGVQARIDLRGGSLADLYPLLGVVLPETPPYVLQGQLSHEADVWGISRIQGRLGKSDLAGDLVYDRARPVALLSGKVRSTILDFNDLGPLIGARGAAQGARKDVPPPSRPVELARPTAGTQQAQAGLAPAAPPAPARPVAAAQRRVLPAAMLDLKRLRAMDADVWYEAVKVRHVESVPLQSLRTHVRLQGGVLLLDPLEAGVAGGRVAGTLRVDGTSDPAFVNVRLDARLLRLDQLFPAIPRTQGSLGRLNGRIDLQGRGNSTARMLGTSDGQIALLLGKGTMSNMLLELLGLDGGEIAKFFLRGDRQVQVRCGAAAFDVRQGLMASRSLVVDTVDTVILGEGRISLADETLDLLLKPSPKDGSILSLRSPLRITGTFADPSAGPDKTALAGRLGLALALGTVNPLLALAATVETGPGKDADCERVMSMAAASAPGGAAASVRRPPNPERP
jgi:AsmA family protein